MFEIKGKYLTSRFYARKIPPISMYVYEMSHVRTSSLWYKTIVYPTRIIAIQEDFYGNYNKRLQKYIRQAEAENLKVRRPEIIPDLEKMYQPVIDEKNIDTLPPGILKIKPNYYYSEVYHEELGRLAAHMSIGDKEESKVFGMVNASAFRSFDRREDRRMCSIANKYLFHKDMEYFASLKYQYYDMVGIQEPMNQMKKEFGGEIIHTYNHIPLPIYYLQKWRKQKG